MTVREKSKSPPAKQLGWLERIMHASKRRTLREHACVRAVKEIHEGDKIIPSGATGAIVYIMKGGVAYGVEFTRPVHAVVTASRDELALV